MVSLVCLCFAMLGPLPGFAPSNSLIVSAAIGRTQRGEGKPASGRAQGEPTVEQASCRKFVGEFYAWYAAHDKNGDPLRAALRRWKPNFSPELVRRLKEDARAAAKSPNEIVGLDFDPVLDTQDPAERYVPGKVTRRGRQFLVDVHSIASGKRSEVPAVTPELTHEHGRWIFTNFRYTVDGKTDDLLSILSRIKADRSKRR